MIIGICGWTRSFKTGMGAVLATHPENFNELSPIKYGIKQGFGNLNLYKTPYPWTYLETSQLIEKIKFANQNHIRNTLFFIDEADQVYNPRDYTLKQQTENLKGIGQHDKMGNVYIVTYQLGDPDDPLLGVDKILRSNMRVRMELELYDPFGDFAIYNLENRNYRNIPNIRGVVEGVSKYFGYWDHLQPVI